MAKNNNNNDAASAYSPHSAAIRSAEAPNPSPTRASIGVCIGREVVPTRHVAPERGATGRRYGGESDSTPIPTPGPRTVAAPEERFHVLWEDRSTGSREVVPPRQVAAEHGATGRRYVGESDSSPIPTRARGTVAAPDKRFQVAWEDRSTGSYYRYNRGVHSGGDSYRWYENVTVRDAESGFEGKYYTEEKYTRVAHDDATHDHHNADDDRDHHDYADHHHDYYDDYADHHHDHHDYYDDHADAADADHYDEW